MSSIQDPNLLAAGCAAINDWAIEYQRFSARYVSAATIPLLDSAHAVPEIHRAAELGFKAAYFSVTPGLGARDRQYTDDWEPVWSAIEETGLVIAFHIGAEAHDATTMHGAYMRGPGGALLNYMETTYGGQRAVSKMIASEVFDRHPEIKVIVSEGGTTWGPFVADRLDEAYRQHYSMVNPQQNVYASFQHDRSAVKAMTAMGWRNDMTVGAFQELCPHVPDAPANGTDVPLT